MPVNPRPEGAGLGARIEKTLEFVTFEGLPASGHMGAAPPFPTRFQGSVFGVLFGGPLGLVGSPLEVL